MKWLRTAWLDALIAFTAAAVIWTELIVWAVTARPPDPLLTGFAASALLAAAARAGWRIASAGGQSSSPPSPLPPSPPSPSPLPEAHDGG